MDQVHRGSPWTRGQRNVPTPRCGPFAVIVMVPLWTFSFFPLSFLRRSKQPGIIITFLVFPFLADPIFYTSYVNRQHFRLQSFASLCLDCSNMQLIFNMVWFAGQFCLTAVSSSRQRHDIRDFSCCPLSRAV